MKRFLLPVFLIFSLSAQAQWSAGIRTGIGNWAVSTFSDKSIQSLQPSIEPEKINQSIWQNQVYVRRELGDWIALEGALSLVSVESTGQFIGLCGTGLPADYSYVSDTKFHERVNSLELRGMLCAPFMRWRRLSNELGFVLAPGISTVEEIRTVAHVSTSGTEYSDQKLNDDSRSCIQFGCEDQLRYRIGKRFDAMIAGSLRYMNGARFVNNGATLQAGIGYRF